MSGAVVSPVVAVGPWGLTGDDHVTFKLELKEREVLAVLAVLAVLTVIIRIRSQGPLDPVPLVASLLLAACCLLLPVCSSTRIRSLGKSRMHRRSHPSQLVAVEMKISPY